MLTYGKSERGIIVEREGTEAARRKPVQRK